MPIIFGRLSEYFRHAPASSAGPPTFLSSLDRKKLNNDGASAHYFSLGAHHCRAEYARAIVSRPAIEMASISAAITVLIAGNRFALPAYISPIRKRGHIATAADMPASDWRRPSRLIGIRHCQSTTSPIFFHFV